MFLTSNEEALYCSDDNELEEIRDILCIPVSKLNEKFEPNQATAESNLIGTGNKRNLSQIEENIDYISQHPPSLLKSENERLAHKQHKKKHISIYPVDSNGEYKKIEDLTDKQDIETYSKIISDLFAPFGRLINNEQFNIYTSDYKFFQTYNFEETTFAEFVDKISDFETYWSLIANIFEKDTLEIFNENFLNSMCYDLSKSVFIVANSIILKTELQNNKSEDFQSSQTLLSLMKNNPQLFPWPISIREIGFLASYFAQRNNDESLEICTIVYEFVYDSVLLAPHIQLTIMYFYGYFLKYLKHMSNLNSENLNSQSQNIYLFCLKLLTNESNLNDVSLTTEGEITLVIFILNKFMDFIFKSLKINKLCESQKNFSNSNPELDEELRSSGQFTIEKYQDFEESFISLIQVAKQTVNSICLHIFNYASVAHENSILFL
jgi:hypothetical protein